MKKAKKILLELQEYLELGNFQELAGAIGVNQTTIYSWIKHDKIAGTGKILAKCPEINLYWLETGEGSMFRNQQTNTTGQNSIQAGRDMVAGNQSITAGGSGYDLSADEERLIYLLREVGGRRIIKKYTKELEDLLRHIEENL